MFDPRPDFGHPDRGLRDALRPAPAAPIVGADVQAEGVLFTVGVTAIRSADGAIAITPVAGSDRGADIIEQAVSA